MVVYMVEVKGGRGMYVDIFLIFDVEKRFIYFLVVGTFVGATLSQTLIRKDWLSDTRVHAA